MTVGLSGELLASDIHMSPYEQGTCTSPPCIHTCLFQSLLLLLGEKFLKFIPQEEKASQAQLGPLHNVSDI